MTSLEALSEILNLDGFIGFIQGGKGKGKTDISLLIAEICYMKGYRTHIATNIWTESYMIEKQIINIPDLKTWLNSSGRKLFILDEAGKHLRRMGFMSRKNQALLELVQLIRHYDAGLICIAPAQRFIDSGYLDPDVIDFIIKKINLHFAKLYLTQSKVNINMLNIPKTSIKFNSKDIAELTLDKKVDLSVLPLCCQVAAVYAQYGTYKHIREQLGLEDMQIKREMLKHCAHSTTNH